MPFYEYQCKACGQQTEVMQKFSDAPLRKCPSCGKNQLVKLISAPVFRLKGSGWYETDFKGDQDKKRNLAVEKDEPPAKEASKDDAKPAEKPVEKVTEKPAATGDKGDPGKSTRKASAKTAGKAKPAARRPAAKKSKTRR